MPKKSTVHPIGFSDPADFSRLRDRLQEINYCKDGIVNLIGKFGQGILSSADVPPLLRITNGGTPLETMVRLFLIGVRVPLELARSAFEPMSLERSAEAGIITIQDDHVTGNFHLQPYHDFLFAHDSIRALQSQGREDWVMGIGNSTMMLSNLAVRRKIRQMLDLCSGCGCHALLAAKHSDRVIAVDCNPRATAYSEFNANLNKIDNVEAIVGNLFEPVVDERFSLVVSNPPFVISPSSKFIYRDGGLRGDEFCRQLIGDAPAYMEEYGYLLMLFNVAHYKGHSWKSRLLQWFEGIGCDVWVMHTRTRDVSSYASTWIKTTEGIGIKEIGHRYEEWMHYYEREGIEAVSDCTLIMRRKTSGRNWVRLDDSPEDIIGPVGNDIIRAFELREFLESASKEVLMNTRLMVAEPVRMRQEFKPSGGAWTGGTAELFLEKGLNYKCGVDMYFAGFVARCDGQRTVRELLTELAGILECNIDLLTENVIEFVRQLIVQGFLIPKAINNSVE